MSAKKRTRPSSPVSDAVADEPGDSLAPWRAVILAQSIPPQADDEITAQDWADIGDCNLETARRRLDMMVDSKQATVHEVMARQTGRKVNAYRLVK